MYTYECRNMVAVLLEGGTYLYDKFDGNAPWGTSLKGYDSQFYEECDQAQGRWSRMPRREARPWIERAKKWRKKVAAEA